MRKGKGRALAAGAIAAAVCLLMTGLFYWIAAQDWRIEAAETQPLSAGGMLTDLRTEVRQTFSAPCQTLHAVSLTPGELGGEGGALTVRILRGGEELWRTERPRGELRMNELNALEMEKPIRTTPGEELTLCVSSDGQGLTLWTGTAVQTGRAQLAAMLPGALSQGGKPAQGALVMSVRGSSARNDDRLIWPVGAAISLGMLALGAALEASRAKGRTNPITRAADTAVRYRFLLKQLVRRDFKVKYQASLLGVMWSVLNPLLTMGVYYLVFSTVFRSDVAYFPAYLVTGIVLFNYFSESTSLGLNAVVGNSGLITKVYMPRWIYPLSRVLSSAVNLAIAFVPMLLVMSLTGVPFGRSMLLLPVAVGFIVAFCLGMSLLLSTMMVFFRDTQFLWGVAVTLWNFLTPVFYPESIIPEALRTLYHCNPLYQFIYFLRCITIGGVTPNPVTFVYCALAAALPLALGWWAFRKNEDRFVLYL